MNKIITTIALLLPLTAFAWDVRVVQNEPIMTSGDTVGGTMIAIGTRNNDCSAPVLSIANYLIDTYEESTRLGTIALPSALRFADGTVAPLPQQKPQILKSEPTGNGIAMFQHVPSDKLYAALMNTDTLEYSDPIFNESWSKHENADFTEKFNEFMGLCFQMYGLGKGNPS